MGVYHKADKIYRDNNNSLSISALKQESNYYKYELIKWHLLKTLEYQIQLWEFKSAVR